MTEGYLWTGIYPEAQKIIDEGRGQSMELGDNLTGSWTKDSNGNPEFFIINEAIITKLCVLGEDVEPCFEGASVTKMQYSLDDNFKKQVFDFMEQMREVLRKGETTVEIKETNPEVKVDPVVEPEVAPVADPELPEPEIVEPAEVPEVGEPEGKPEVEGEEPEAEGEPEAPASAAYNLDDVVEYAELSTKYAELEATNTALTEKVSALESENAELKTFKLNIERKDKENMIASFYMLSEEDKANVKEHIDEYSLDEIEKELSVICVRNKVNFSLDNKENTVATVFNINSVKTDSKLPAWLKEVDNVANNRK